MVDLARITKEPYRCFFPLGILYLLWGALVWLPQIWHQADYPVLAHRYLMLNGFTASFMAGFLMTAVPQFSKTKEASLFEVLSFLLISIVGIVFAYFDQEQLVSLVSAIQAALILIFLFTRVSSRKENPPYRFVFIFVGLFLWLVSAVSGLMVNSDYLKRLHYEGAIAAVILGVGGLGHIEIVAAARERYEKPISLLATVPLLFFILMVSFVTSYFVPAQIGSIIRALVVTIIAMKYWRLWKFPVEKTALTWGLWLAAWLIVLSFILSAAWEDGMIHAAHSFFINGIVLFCLLIGTRVLQSHGPKNKLLENSKRLYLVIFLIVFTAATRVTAILMPLQYLSHLGYSALLLVLAVLLWSYQFLRYAFYPSSRLCSPR